MLQQSCSGRAIARALSRAQSSIARELRRNGYRPPARVRPDGLPAHCWRLRRDPRRGTRPALASHTAYCTQVAGGWAAVAARAGPAGGRLLTRAGRARTARCASLRARLARVARDHLHRDLRRPTTRAKRWRCTASWLKAPGDRSTSPIRIVRGSGGSARTPTAPHRHALEPATSQDTEPEEAGRGLPDPTDRAGGPLHDR